MSPIIDKQMRFVELGRLRMGSKGDKGQPQRLATWRLTSASKQLLDAAAEVYGGTVQPWQGAPNEGYFELITETAEIDVTIPPIAAPGALLSQWYELWSAGGCQRRCDGVTEGISGGGCLCDPTERECKAVTRMSVMLPKLPGLGVWRLDTGGANAALELPGTFQVLAGASDGRFVQATLRIEPRVKKVAGEKFPRRFTVPVLNVPGATLGELLAGDGQRVIGPAQVVDRRPALEAGPAPAAPAFKSEAAPGFGEPPALPSVGEPQAVEPAAVPVSPTVESRSASPTVDLRSPAQIKKLNALVGMLRQENRDPTEWIYDEYHREKIVGADGVLHWKDISGTLTTTEAESLHAQLSGFLDKLTNGGRGYFAERASEVLDGAA